MAIPNPREQHPKHLVPVIGVDISMYPRVCAGMGRDLFLSVKS